ncbi:hypothetical protein ACFSJP_31365, partial [Actinopolymorpha cephalotaxi]
MVTDGTFLPDGSAIVLRTYADVRVLRWPGGKPERTISLSQPQRQGESIAVGADGKQLFLGSEGANSPVYSMSVAAAAPAPSRRAPGATRRQPVPDRAGTHVQRQRRFAAERPAALDPAPGDRGRAAGRTRGVPGLAPAPAVGVQPAARYGPPAGVGQPVAGRPRSGRLGFAAGVRPPAGVGAG